MQRKKLFYIPGLISLIGLPILIFIFHPEDKAWETVVKLNIPSDDITNIHTFSKAYTRNVLKGKKIEQINLNEFFEVGSELNGFLLDKEFQFIESEFKRVQFTHDTSTVIDVQFGEENTYGQWIYLVNLAKLYQFSRYIYINDDFYLFPNEPPPPLVTETIDNFPQLDVHSYQPPSKWDILKWEMEARFNLFVYDIKQNILLSIGFIVLIFIPFLINIASGRIKKHFNFSF